MKKILLNAILLLGASSYAQTIKVNFLGRYTDGRDAACEISAYDYESKKLYITNAAADSIDIVDISDATSPVKVGQIDVLSYGGEVNSVVACGNGYIAAAIEANDKTDSGVVVFYDTAGNFVNSVTVGALPDMIAITHDGNKLLVANEGEPSDDYTVDPEGSVAIIDISGGIDNVSQSDVNILRLTGAPTNIPGSIRKPGVAWEKDLEPEYIAVSEDDSKAFVVCQESNVLLVIDIENETIESYTGLGFKDHSIPGNALDPSNRDSGIKIANWNVKGVYQPDAIDSYTVNGNTYVVSANEGDGRDYAGYSWETRIKNLDLDSTVFPNYVELQNDSNLGRLTTFTSDVIGDTNNDGFVEELYCYGARSFSIWDEEGNLVFDSGDDFENYIKDNHADWFNCNSGERAEFDERSDDKGPEPEGIVMGKLRDNYFVFIGLERQGGVMIYDITDPENPVFETYIEEFDEGTGIMTDIAPEGLTFISADDSHNGMNMLVIGNERSGTVSIYEIEDLFVGQEERTVSTEFSVYPNPAKDLLTVEIPNFSKNMQFDLSDALGKVIYSGNARSTHNQIDISELPKGMYFLTLKSTVSEFATETRKVIKE